MLPAMCTGIDDTPTAGIGLREEQVKYYYEIYQVYAGQQQITSTNT
jgi:hypothetical protein